MKQKEGETVEPVWYRVTLTQPTQKDALNMARQLAYSEYGEDIERFEVT